MENDAISYSQSAAEVAMQLNSPKGKHTSPRMHPQQPEACTEHPTDKQPSEDLDELSIPEPFAPSSESSHLDETPSNATNPNESTANRKEDTPPSDPVTSIEVAPAKRSVMFADDSPPDGEPQSKRKIRKFGSTTSPVPATPPTAGKKRGRPPKNPTDADGPRKRGRLRKNPVLAPAPAATGADGRAQRDPAAARNGLLAIVARKRPLPGLSAKRSSAMTDDPNANTATPGPDPGFGPVDDELRRLVHEVFVVNALGLDGGVSIPWAAAVQMHAVLVPGLPAPRGEVFVGADLAVRIRALFDGVGE